VAIAAGLGGGLLLGNIMSPQQPKYPSSEVTRLEQRNAQPSIQAMNGASQPVPYQPVTQASTTAEPPVRLVSPQSAEPKPQSGTNATATPQPAAAQQPVAAVEQPAVRERTAPEDANARARDADLKRDARRAEESRRKAERRKQRGRDGDDLNDVEASVRQATESRPVFAREESRPIFGGDPGFGRIRIFDGD
jgi:hypothetical protein